MPLPRACTYVLAACGLLAGCSGASSRVGFEGEKSPDTDPTDPPSTGPLPTETPKTEPPPTEISEVFGHSRDTLYRLDPTTQAVTTIGKFQNCGSGIIDIALDEKSNIIGASFDVLYRIDKTTAACTEIHSGDYPNSLSFVPKGTLDPNEEALVGYVGSDYFRIDVNTGEKTKLGSLGGSLVSSGDIVSVKGGKTYLTVKGGTCSKFDCLVEVDPVNGKKLKDWGSIEHDNVFGLSFWGGRLYGFSDKGKLFEVTFGATQLATKEISVPPGLSFWGAGSSTTVPLTFPPQ